MKLRLLVALALQAFVMPCFATPQIPSEIAPVMDAGDFFTPTEETDIDATIREVFQQNGPQFVVWTLQSLEGMDIAQLGIEAADKWKLGRAGKDDGAILLIVRAERKTRLEVGRGLEGVVPDIVANRLLQSVLRPALRQNQASYGVIQVIRNVQQLSDGKNLPQNFSEEEEKGSLPFSPGLLLIVFFVMMFIFPFVFRKHLRGGRRGGGPPTIFGGWGGGRGGRGSGGGWRGGGGGFSGGGSSGDW